MTGSRINESIKRRNDQVRRDFLELQRTTDLKVGDICTVLSHKAYQIELAPRTIFNIVYGSGKSDELEDVE